MSEQLEMIDSLLDELAAEVMLLEPGDLMAYGEVLDKLERLSIAAEVGQSPALPALVDGLRAYLEGMILGEVDQMETGLEVVATGISLCQELSRGDADQGAVDQFAATHGVKVAGATPPLAAPAPEPERPAAPAQAPPAAPPARPEPAPSPAPAVAAPAEPVAEDPPLSDDDIELLSGFVLEAMEHLESIEVNSLQLEEDPTNADVLNAIFRPFHTIKGVSGFLNLGDINHLSHELENLLDKAREGKLILDGQAIDLILAGVDRLRKMIEEAHGAGTEHRSRYRYPTEDLVQRVQAVLEGGGPAAEDAAEASPAQAPTPAAGAPVRETASTPAAAPAPGPQADADEADGDEPRRGAAGPAGGGDVRTAEVKVSTAKLDNLLDMVGELVIAQSMVQANPHVQAISDRKLATDLNQLSRITTELQKSTMAMRMVPIKQTFQRMVRVVRDTAKKQGKKVHLIMEGENTEIDRNMVEKFYDPLVHMVRNSVDHGIEGPELRRDRNKPEEGTVVLAAYHKGGNVCVEIRDDGGGLSREKIVKKAIERGLISDDEGMSEEDVFHLIMKPGFSTADKITDISGRGVGMDVVQKAIDGLRGKIEIRSTLGEGTTLTISLPLTLAIIDGMVVQCGQQRYILPTIAMVESLRPEKKDYTTLQGKGEMIIIRGNLLPLVRLHSVVGAHPEKTDPWECLVVVVEHHGQRRCLMVDKLVGRQEVVIKSLGEALKNVKAVAGGAIMGDGRVGLILDVEGIFKSHDNRRG